MNELTFEEELRLVTGRGAWHTDDCNGKLPSILLADGPHGLRTQEKDAPGQNNASIPATCMPAECAIACSFNPEVARKMADTIATEALSAKVSVLLGCGVNIKRSPLCGRNFEYFSEDPYLSGSMGSAYIGALESRGVATSLKHFAGNSQETHRQTSNSQIDERALREIYLKAFEMTVKNAKPSTIMASYNRLNGDYACENKYLLTDILRNEWGYQGAVISDWGACVSLPKCIKAGMDLEMPDSCGLHHKELVTALLHGDISTEDVHRASGRIQALVEKQLPLLQETSFDSKEHHKIAVSLENESAVLLKNEDFLPIDISKEIIVIGEMAEKPRYQGGGSSHINALHTPNVITSLKEHGYTLHYAKGYDVTNDQCDVALEKEALALAEQKLPILFFGGLIESYEGEGYDRTSLAMPDNQVQLFYKLADINSNIAFIAFGGAPMQIPFADKAKAILHMYLGGQGVDNSCADLICGNVNPSGKLAESYPLCKQDIPCYNYFGTNSDDVEYRESIFVGYRYYDTYEKPVAWHFGHGLSYTTFAYKNLSVTPISADISYDVSFTIKNTGAVFGKEAVQLYIQNPEGTYLRAKKELRNFTKVALEAGEEKEVHFTLNANDFSLYDVKSKRFIVPSGSYHILIGASSVDIRLSEELYVSGVDYQRDDTSHLSEYFNQTGNTFTISKEQFERLYGKKTSDFSHVSVGDYSVYNSLEQLAKTSMIARVFLGIAQHMIYQMFPDKPKSDPEVMMLIQGAKEGTLDAVMCQSGGMVPYKIAEALVLFANHHPWQGWKKLLGRDKK